ncbi:uncharacterized protein LOC133286741 [Gastrolobium bilobum]|uniref:uncharacterized protein LOC133286741 n=1 Tax=Gastrolobium bilobum TaxID=150636 RepID=UPI002AB0FA42|nr:uncharacterized protein LOC133286741 [Gastrolobium bilobum]
MRVQDLAEELANTRAEIHQHINQLTEAMETRLTNFFELRFNAIDSRIRDFPSPTIPPPPPVNHNHQQPNMNGAGHEQRIALRSIKMEIPLFEGKNPHLWIFKCEMFFRIQQIPEELKVELAGLRMEGAAASWFQWIHNSGTVQHWDQFTLVVRQRFGGDSYTDMRGALSKLSQVGSLTDYVRDFEILMNQVPGLPDDLLLSFFASGLSLELRRVIQLHEPKTLHQAIQLAFTYDAHHRDLRSSFSNPARKSNSRYVPSPSPQSVSTVDGPTHVAPTANSLTVKRLPPEEAKKRRELGLCFSCEEKWSIGHRCKSKMLLLIGDGDDQDVEPDEEIVWQSNEMPQTLQEAALNALSMSSMSKLLQFIARVGTGDVRVMVDSGSSHNFIQKHVAIQLGLPISQSRSMKVILGNGEFMLCNMKCLAVSLQIQSFKCCVDLWILDLKDLHIILGMPWLESLGKVVHNYVDLSMEFSHNGQVVQLKAITDAKSFNSNCLSLVSEESAADHISDEIMNLKTLVQQDIWQVIAKFHSVFSIPQSLPPFQSIDHSIHLIENSKPVNVKPYRYGHSQKAEIEKQVQGLLAAGYIRSSTSPYSSPVLLVKKSDGSWRMCIDYRALNAITIRDCFPIPTIDELLDELCHASIFSKLDLRAGYH